MPMIYCKLNYIFFSIFLIFNGNNDDDDDGIH